ncbi:MAG: hypothetical protein SGARI_004187 [Bacillariaceae sp.]
MLSLAEALSPGQRAQCLCDALVHDRTTRCLSVLVLATTSELIREVSYLLDGSVALNDEEKDCFPSIASLTDNVQFLLLIEECKSDASLRERVKKCLTSLVTRFSAVAESKDLRPRISSSQGKKFTVMQTALETAVNRLRRQWRSVMEPKLIENGKTRLKEEVYALLGIDRGSSDEPRKKLGMFGGATQSYVRAGNNWMHGLAFIHSNQNKKLCRSVKEDSDGGEAVVSQRIVELGLGFGALSAKDFKIFRPHENVVGAESYRNIEFSRKARMKKFETTIDSLRSLLKDHRMEIVEEDDDFELSEDDDSFDDDTFDDDDLETSDEDLE